MSLRTGQQSPKTFGLLTYAAWARPRASQIRSRRRSLAGVAHVLIIHAVEDYDAWKRVFDDAADIRREAGERRFQVLTYEDDPNRVVHFSEWESIARAKEFFQSPRLVEIRRQAGVHEPEFIYLDQVDAGVL